MVLIVYARDVGRYCCTCLEKEDFGVQYQTIMLMVAIVKVRFQPVFLCPGCPIRVYGASSASIYSSCVTPYRSFCAHMHACELILRVSAQGPPGAKPSTISVNKALLMASEKLRQKLINRLRAGLVESSGTPIPFCFTLHKLVRHVYDGEYCGFDCVLCGLCACE
eukprot:COSAG05_NODE_1887_length_3886_cov_6.005545_2_plen_165_part_00